MNGAQLIADERWRQISMEGWSKENDSQHTSDELSMAAVSYATPIRLRRYRSGSVPSTWPTAWWNGWWKPFPNDRVRELVKAGALIAAEIDRLLDETSK